VTPSCAYSRLAAKNCELSVRCVIRRDMKNGGTVCAFQIEAQRSKLIMETVLCGTAAANLKILFSSIRHGRSVYVRQPLVQL
jgi:hypothetical protein